MTGTHNPHRLQKGFTLIELIIAIGLFSIIVTIAVGGFVNVLRTQRQVSGLIAVQSNAGLALEQMAREIRTGYLFCRDIGGTTPNANCPSPPTAPDLGCTVNADLTWTCSNLHFYNAQTEEVNYSCPGCSVGDGVIERSDANENSGVAEPITGNDVVVKYLTFTLFGNLEGDHWNPRITIAMGVAPSSTDRSLAGDVLNLETTVSAREIDCGTSVGC